MKRIKKCCWFSFDKTCKVCLISEVPLVFLYLLCLVNGIGSQKDVFTDVTNPGSLQHLVVDKEHGRVFVGATNRLYQLTDDLKLEKVVVNGPKEDNPNCPPPTSECQCFGSNCKEFEKMMMNSVSKALTIDYRRQRLISCINLYQGHCDKHLLSDINITDNAVWTMLVPNDEESSVVMFVASGPPNPASTDVLYVGATRSTKGLPIYKDIVPAVCMRSLQDLNFVSDDILTPSRIDVEVQQRDLFRVHYVYGFSSLGFSYFLMVQKISAITDSEKYVTQISRICQSDRSLYSYTEVPLECHHTGVHYNILRAAYLGYPGTNLAKSLGLPDVAPFTDMEHVLVAVFTNQSHSKLIPVASAMCIYSMRDVQRKFTNTIQKCFHGVGNTGPDHFVQPKPCSETPFEIGDDYCGQHDLNHPIKGMDPVSNQAVITWNGVNMTSVVMTSTGDFTVAFVGTENGFVKKVTIDSGYKATEYESIVVQHNISIKQDMEFDRFKDHIYVMTDKKVLKIPVQNCSQYTKCGQCLDARDPYCGWCSLDRRCTQRANCPSGDSGGSHWLPFNSDQCPTVVNMAPAQAQKQSTSTSPVIMVVQNLPLSSSAFQCAFSGHGITRLTPVTLQTNQGSRNTTLRCDTPMANLLPPFDIGSDHIQMDLLLVSNGHDFLSVTNFTFFDCTIHSTCTKCTNSNFPCTWCVELHRCTNNKEECESDVLITGKQVPGHSDTPGPEYCPRIMMETNSSEILIPSGSEMRLLVKAMHLQDFQSIFRCLFTLNGGIEKNGSLVVQRNEEYIECESVLFQFSASTPFLNVPFNVLWSLHRKPLDNPHDIHVQVYKCSNMAPTCGRCRAIDVRYGCGWCTVSRQCSIKENCARGGQWLRRDQTCRDPAIIKIHPVIGPVEGGTNLTITGENLGVAVDDTSVHVASVLCPVRFYTEPSVELVCQTSRAKNQSIGSVVLVISGQYTATSLFAFSYVRPVVYSFSPLQGPQSGGTLLNLFGHNLNAGSSLSIILSNRTMATPCAFVEGNATNIACVTLGNLFPYEASLLQLMIDDAVVIYSASSFKFVEDPVISTVAPEKSIISGGTKMTVKGERLDAVISPQIIVYVMENNVTGSCEAVRGDEMVCISPNLHKMMENLGIEVDEGEPYILEYGFIMDEVLSTRNMSAVEMGSHLMLIYPDPTFEKFEGGVKQFFFSNKEYLTINGKYLNLGLTEDDMRVTISDMPCLITSVSSTQLTCLPSDQDTIPSNAQVLVHVGNTMFEIGRLNYEGSRSSISLPIIIATAICVGIFIVIIVIVCIFYRHKSRENKRVVKQMKNQMDTLEARVAQECKEAFTELQTDMTIISSDICGPGSTPFRDYCSFCMRVLFPNSHNDENPIMRSYDAEIPSIETTEKGLVQFDQLLSNKTFLLIFIRTLEQCKDFTAKQKVHVASLLSVTLQDHMEYETDILKTLLADLIERAVDGGRGGKYHPKLLLRRTESVAEKMLTNWFTFLLYRFLRERAGEPFFLLFRAIKQHIDKGPVDSETGHAKYSLSEDKLIRQQVDFKFVTLTVRDSGNYANQNYDVKVLNCDTITQVKEKILDSIYRSSPFSTWPDKDDLDLEWIRSARHRVILQDEDLSTKIEGDMKRYNTLAHYKVPTDGSIMALVPRKQASLVNLALSSERLPQTSKYDALLNGSLPHSQSLSMSHTNNMTSDFDARYFHLVKPRDSDHLKEGEQFNKMVSEVYLTRLLSTKMTLQQFVDDLFKAIFSTTSPGSCLPMAIKYMFDFLDDQAILHGITDHEVVHTWKSNSLPLRFWVNVIKNPDFIFDVFKSNIVDSCLSVVAQTFMDSCSMSEHKLSKDSPSSKLLYAKDIPRYKKLVKSYYEDVKRMPSVSDRDMNDMLREESQIHADEFNTTAALSQLYQYTIKYNDDLEEALKEDEFARSDRLQHRLTQVHMAMETHV